ncbi:MAG: hypothetical protein HYR88_03130 [Verrucomicrobia bacterium]|nr:hypothetical protein [Verrucomicrobiota bacterium]MBI3866953.1 hypothetical protein [Verrucomicrobiota bacterium]
MKHRSKEKWIKTLRSTLLMSFYYSCLIHVIVFGLWKLGILELPDELVALIVRRKPAVVKQASRSPAALTNAAQMPKEIPLAFIEVEPERSTPDQPKDPKYYSKANSTASNPEPRKEAPIPQVDGKQDKIAKLRDVPRAVLPPPPPPTPVPPKPASPPPAPPPTPKPEMTLQPAPARDDVVPIPTPEPAKPRPAKPAEVAKDTEPPPPKETLSTSPPSPATQPQQPPPPPKQRPRTLAQARQDAGIVGEKMRQDGGVRRPGKLAVDAKATPFGEYDAALIRAVQERWYYLLDNTALSTRSGKVVLQFNLKFDGTVTDMKVKETEVGEVLALLCERAVGDPSPYPRWPLDMHRMIGGNVRPVVFTFLYY